MENIITVSYYDRETQQYVVKEMTEQEYLEFQFGPRPVVTE